MPVYGSTAVMDRLCTTDVGVSQAPADMTRSFELDLNIRGTGDYR